MNSSAVAIFVLVALTTSLTVQGQYIGVLQTWFNTWRRVLEVNAQTNQKLSEKGYDMDKLTAYSISAIQTAEQCYNDAMNEYPDFAKSLKVKYITGISSYPNKDWGVNMLDSMIKNVQEKESDPLKAAKVLTTALARPVECYLENMKEQMSRSQVKTDAENKATNLFDCFSYFYQATWRNFDVDNCDDTKPDFWQRCDWYETCDIFEVNKM